MPNNPRISLTKKQIQEGIGAELLTLCQTITEDGSLSKSEVVALRDWLRKNRNADLPAITFLVALVERITADGKVSKDELTELHRAIEKIMPVPDRQKAAAARRAIEVELELKQKAARDEAEKKEYEQLRRNSPIFSEDFPTAGVFYEGRDKVVAEYVNEGDQVFLVRDTTNKHSRHAIQIRIRNGLQIGFVRDEIAVDMAPLMDQNLPHVAFVKRMWSCDRGHVPIIQASIYRPDAQVDGLVFFGKAPPEANAREFRFEPPPTSKQKPHVGCAVLFTFFLSLSVYLFCKLA